MNELKCARFFVHGRVQGVGFRYFVSKQALRLHLCGYAKNLFDSRVEVVVEGKQNAINELHTHLKIGPERSYVESCSIELENKTTGLSGFQIK